MTPRRTKAPPIGASPPRPLPAIYPAALDDGLIFFRRYFFSPRGSAHRRDLADWFNQALPLKPHRMVCVCVCVCALGLFAARPELKHGQQSMWSLPAEQPSVNTATFAVGTGSPCSERVIGTGVSVLAGKTAALRAPAHAPQPRCGGRPDVGVSESDFQQIRRAGQEAGRLDEQRRVAHQGDRPGNKAQSHGFVLVEYIMAFGSDLKFPFVVFMWVCEGSTGFFQAMVL